MLRVRNWEQEQVIKKHQLGCYVTPEIKARIRALSRARRISISQLTRELVEFALPRLEAQAQHDLDERP